MRGEVHHIDLTVKDPARSRAFYAAVLGFMGYTLKDDDAGGFDMVFGAGEDFRSTGVVRARGPNAARGHDRYSPGLHHIAWHAESRRDVEAMYALLQEIGAVILDPPADYSARYGAGYYAVFFADPDGLKLEFVYKP